MCVCVRVCVFMCSDLWPGRGGSCFSSLLALCSFVISSTILAGMGSGPAFETLSSSRLLWLCVWTNNRKQSCKNPRQEMTSNFWLTDSTRVNCMIPSFVSVHHKHKHKQWQTSGDTWVICVIEGICQIHLLKGSGQPICFSKFDAEKAVSNWQISGHTDIQKNAETKRTFTMHYIIS